MALGTKEDGHFAWEEVVGKEEELIIFKGLYSPNFVCAKFASLDNIFSFTHFITLCYLRCKYYMWGGKYLNKISGGSLWILLLFGIFATITAGPKVEH